jgi:hypothetical protein
MPPISAVPTVAPAPARPKLVYGAAVPRAGTTSLAAMRGMSAAARGGRVEREGLQRDPLEGDLEKAARELEPVGEEGLEPRQHRRISPLPAR